jgi:hypothetical protein
MPELGTYGSVRGAAGNSRPYRECRPMLRVRQAPGPASESLQGRNPRFGGRRRSRERYGDFAIVCWLVDLGEQR